MPNGRELHSLYVNISGVLCVCLEDPFKYEFFNSSIQPLQVRVDLGVMTASYPEYV